MQTCRIFRHNTPHISTALHPRTPSWKAKRHNLFGTHACMAGMTGKRNESDQWTEVLKQQDECNPDSQQPRDTSDINVVAVNPHRMHCTMQESDEWARVLSLHDDEPSTQMCGPASGLHPAHHQQPKHSRTVAVVIECGSHSTRALICDSSGQQLARLCYDTLLSQGLPQEGGLLQAAAVFRCVAALESIRLEVDSCSQLPQQNASGSCGLSCSAHEAQAEGAAAIRGASRSGCVGEDSNMPSEPGAAPGEAACHVRVVGTAALRRCSNPEAIGQHVQRLFGVDLEVLSGEDEGRLAYAGATRQATAAAADRQLRATTAAATAAGICSQLRHATGAVLQPSCLLLVDLGGMSTEVIWPVGAATQASPQPAHGSGLHIVSLPLGCVALTQRYFATAKSAQESLETCTQHVLDVLAQHAPALGKAHGPGAQEWWQMAAHVGSSTHMQEAVQQEAVAPQLVLTGGTATTVAALLLQLPKYDSQAVNGCTLRREELVVLANSLHRSHATDLAVQAESGDILAVWPAARQLLQQYQWLTEDRCVSLPAGLTALIAIMSWLGIERAAVSDADLLDGSMAELVLGQ